MWTGKHTAILSGVSAASLAVGCASGWFLARRTIEKAYAIRLTEEMRQTKAFYENLYGKDDPEKLVEDLGREVQDSDEEVPPKSQYDYTSDEVPQEVLEKVASKMAKAQAEVEAEAAPMHNAFDNPAPSWVQQDEELERKNGVPYIISQEEFNTNEWEFEEGQLTYYEGDDTLADSRDEPIPEQYKAVGELTLERFGHGSSDPNIVYVCNEQMEMIFEIARSTKSFAEDVLGFQEGGTLQHGISRSKRRQPEWDG